MEPPYRAASQIRLDDDGRILDDDLACVSCGYNLRGPLPDGACPECGTSVERSTRGNLLRFSDPKWVGRLASGMKFLVASIALYFFLLLVHLAVRPTSYLGFLTLAGALLIVLVLMLIGYWKLTTPDPGQLETAVRLDARRVTRVATVTAFVMSVAAVFVDGEMTGVIPITFALLATFPTFLYARQLAIRISNTRLANYTRRVMWGWVACLLVGVPIGLAVFSVIVMSAMSHSRGSSGDAIALLLIAAWVGIAVLILAILSLVLLIWYLRAFNQAARQARATWAA